MEVLAIIQDFHQRGFSLAVVATGIEVSPASALTDADREAIRRHKADLLSMFTPPPGTCPKCRRGMNLLDRSDAWFCLGCRIWADSKGQPLPPVVKTRPVYREEVVARKLLADLEAAGCGIVWDGDELRISNLSKIPTALWMRLENADSAFLRVAREMVQSFETRSDLIH
ncbi:MAG: hypothetical protein M3X11_13600 [Acidobacteriota bacterium]|nr:hypothetical protein [Acidobacteriota bacterium]